MSAPPPSLDPRSPWSDSIDGLVFDLHRSGFTYSLILHIVVLLSLATLCIGTDPASRRAALVIALEGSGMDAVEEGSLDLAVVDDAAPAAAAAAAAMLIADATEPVPDASDTPIDGFAADHVRDAADAGGLVAAEAVRAAGSGVAVGRGNGRGPGKASFFGVEATGDKFVYVVDFSGSMQGQRIEQARSELRRSIESLPETASFFIILFNHAGMKMPASELVPATPANKEQFCDWVDRQGIGGGTNPIEALVDAVRLKPNAIFLLTDGQFADPQATIRLVSRTRGPKFHAVAFHDNAGEKILKHIARAGRGTYRFQPP